MRFRFRRSVDAGFWVEGWFMFEFFSKHELSFILKKLREILEAK